LAHTTRSLQNIEAVRRFSRFYTQRLGVLQERLLQSPYPLPAARLIYEVAHQDGITASELADQLRLDPGYVSRLIRQLHESGVVERKPSPEDGRVTFLSLTPPGRKAFAKLNAASRAQVERMLDSLTSADQRRVVEAMRTVERLLGSTAASKTSYLLRAHEPGDMGWVVQRHGLLYYSEYGWDEAFEALVAEIAARFLRNLDPARERCWIAEADGENVGCVFLVRKSKTVAQLRLLLVEPRARGLGIGKRLVGECTRFARQAGYRKIILWTNSVLDAARHLYELEGYRRVKEEQHHSFGHDLVGQFWELEL
jgi:DNA-binding MarR family transcriptional regulator/N-acetylglutamate synthase-like GNAT family acetyltransferase